MRTRRRFQPTFDWMPTRIAPSTTAIGLTTHLLASVQNTAPAVTACATDPTDPADPPTDPIPPIVNPTSPSDPPTGD